MRKLFSSFLKRALASLRALSNKLNNDKSNDVLYLSTPIWRPWRDF